MCHTRCKRPWTPPRTTGTNIDCVFVKNLLLNYYVSENWRFPDPHFDPSPRPTPLVPCITYIKLRRIFWEKSRRDRNERAEEISRRR